MKATKSDELKHRQLTLWDYLQKDTAEQESYAGVCVSSRMAETDTTNTSEQEGGLLDEILSPKNMNRAYNQVKRNKGAGGVDQMTVDELGPWIREHRDEMLKSLRDGSYRSQSVRRVEIPKESGKTRKLGIPTVVDRMIQQAVSQVLSSIYEE